MILENLITILGFMVLLFSFADESNQLKGGYYYSAHGHSATLFKVKKNKIEWYNDNAIKTYGCGNYTINLKDSLVEITFNKIWKSQKPRQDVIFEYSHEVKWNNGENKFELSKYTYRKESKSIKELMKRVKSQCSIKLDR